MQNKLLIVDDDVELTGLLQEYFEGEGFDVAIAHDGLSGLEAAHKSDVDLVVLDVMMPAMDGMDVLQRLREDSMVPVIMLTARGNDLDRIRGLELGADDYLPKPCNPRELLARIRAVMRRAQTRSTHGNFSVDDIELNQGNRQVLRGGVPIVLTSTEFSILQTLLQHQGDVVSKRELYLSALGREPVRHDRSVDMHVSNLRKKLGLNPAGENRIETIRGIGYQYRVS